MQFRQTFSKLEDFSRKSLWNKHRTTTRKGWHLVAFLSNKTVSSKIRFVGKIKPKNPLKSWWVPGLERIVQKRKCSTSTLSQKNQCNSEFSTWAPFLTLQILLPNPPPLRTAPGSPKPFLHLLHQSSELYCQLQYSCFFCTDFHFKLINLLEKVHH